MLTYLICIKDENDVATSEDEIMENICVENSDNVTSIGYPYLAGVVTNIFEANAMVSIHQTSKKQDRSAIMLKHVKKYNSQLQNGKYIPIELTP